MEFLSLAGWELLSGKCSLAAIPDMVKDDLEHHLHPLSVTVLCSSAGQSRVVRGKRVEGRDCSPLLATPEASLELHVQFELPCTRWMQCKV